MMDRFFRRLILLASLLLLLIAVNDSTATTLRMPSYSFLPLLSTAEAPTRLRWPTVQNVTADRAIIAWVSQIPAPGEVAYSTDQSYDWTAVATGKLLHNRYYYSATLSGLQPGTRYYYRVRMDHTDITPWPVVSFATATTGDHFTFVAFGDSHSDRDGSSPPAAQTIAAQMARWPFDLAIHTGDMTFNGIYTAFDRQYYTVYRDLLGQTPFFLVLGNHEYYAHPLPITEFYLPTNGPTGLAEQAYSFDWGSAHFVALDTNQDYALGSPQYAWLVADLAGSRQFWKFVFFHHPPYSSGDGGSDLNVRRVLSPVLERYGVDLVFSGHNHDYERTTSIRDGHVVVGAPAGTVYIVTGGGGGPLCTVRPRSFTAYARSIYHFTRTEVRGCALIMQAIDKDGVVFDTLTLNKCP